MNEQSPIIAFDRHLGQHVDYIDVDYDELVTYMRTRGFDDETISQTKIDIYNDTTSRYHKASGNTYSTHAVYDGKTDKVALFPRNNIDQYQEIRAGRTDIKSNFDSYMSEDISQSLVHELEHKLIKQEGGMREEKRYQRRLIGKKVLYATGAAVLFHFGFNHLAEAIDVDTSNTLVAISTAGMTMASGALASDIFAKYLPGAREKEFSQYVGSPEEVRCRQVEKTAPKLLTIEMSSAGDSALPEVA